MPSLRDIRRRITSVKKTQQITRAMRMVAAAKLRRAQERILAARPYAQRMWSTLCDVRAATPDLEQVLLLGRPSVTCVEVLVITSDRGLAGAFNASILKHASRVIGEQEALGRRVTLQLVGRKAADFFRRRRPGQIAKATVFGEASYDKATEIAEGVIQRFIAGEIDEAILVGSEFVSAMTQTPHDLKILPVASDGAPVDAPTDGAPFSAEPSLASLLDVLAPKVIEVTIYRALLESQAGEYAARMTAMESATRNTEDMIGSLTLRFNRARQAAITRELIEIITGAEAL